MSNKSRNGRREICLMVGTLCIVWAGLWAALAMPETALAAKGGKGGGDSGTSPVSIQFSAGGIVGDGNGSYIDNKKLKVEAVMTPDGHVNLVPNTGSGPRTLGVTVTIPNESPLDAEVWRFILGGWNDNFDMRAMEDGAVRDDVNLQMNTRVPLDAPEGAEGENWILFFDDSITQFGDCTGSTYVTVSRTGDTWTVENKDSSQELSQAALIVQTKVKNKSTFERYGGSETTVTVPPFTAVITLN